MIEGCKSATTQKRSARGVERLSGSPHTSCLIPHTDTPGEQGSERVEQRFLPSDPTDPTDPTDPQRRNPGADSVLRVSRE